MLLLAIPRKFKIFFEKGIYFSFKKTSHMNVFSFFTNWVAFYGKFALFGDFKNIQDFFQKTYRVFSKKLNFWTFWEFSVSQSQITANLLFWGTLKKSRLFSKNVYFFRKNAKIWTFSELSLFQSDSTANLILSESLKILKTVFQKIRNLFRETPIFERFEKSFYFNCILQENS